MKANHYSSILLIALTFAITLTAAAKEPQKKVLFELGPNEVIDELEHCSSFHLGKYGYACILRDTITNVCSFIWNGERKVSSRNLEICKIDLFNYERCLLLYTDDKSVYWETTGERFACESAYVPEFLSGAKTSNSSIYRILFKKMGEWYVRDYDGVVYKRSVGRTTFKSPNGKHMAELKSTGHITIDGKELALPYLLWAPSNWTSPDPHEEDKVIIERPYYSIYVLDNGGCYIEGYFYGVNKNNKQQPYFGSWFINNEKIIELLSPASDTEEQELVLNLDSGELEKDAKYRERFLAEKFEPLTDREGVFSKSHYKWVSELGGCEPYSMTGSETDYTRREQNISIGEDVLGMANYSFNLQDKSLKHIFLANWQYNFVQIDNERYGSACPIEAYYDETSNSFCWVSIEDGRMVQYTFKL